MCIRDRIGIYRSRPVDAELPEDRPDQDGNFRVVTGFYWSVGNRHIQIIRNKPLGSRLLTTLHKPLALLQVEKSVEQENHHAHPQEDTVAGDDTTPYDGVEIVGQFQGIEEDVPL